MAAVAFALHELSFWQVCNSAPWCLQENWAAYTSDKVQRLPHGHLLLYPIEVLTAVFFPSFSEARSANHHPVALVELSAICAPHQPGDNLALHAVSVPKPDKHVASRSAQCSAG